MGSYGLYWRIKRVFDIGLSYAGLFFSAPLWPLISLAVFLDSGRPIFFVQERVGRGGRIFKGLKFRSMIDGAEAHTGPVQAKENDPRVTCVGRFLRATAMDELPQLLNILKGDMSFVGPRPLRPIEIDNQDNLAKSVWEFPGFIKRCQVMPGLTGITQVLASRDIPRQQKFQHDLWYVKNQRPWLDLKLLIFSFLITFRGRWEAPEAKLKAHLKA